MAIAPKKTLARPIKRTKAEIEKEFAEVRTQVEQAKHRSPQS